MDLSFWGSLASIVGLVVSGVTLWAVRQLQTRFRYRASAPLFIDKLARIRAAILEYLDDPGEGTADLVEGLSRLPQTIQDISEIVPARQRRQLGEVRSRIVARGQDLSDPSLRATLHDLTGLLEALENYNEAQQWQS